MQCSFVAAVIIGRFCYQRHKSRQREELGIIEDLPEEMLEMNDFDDDENEEVDPDSVLALADLRSWSHSKQYYSEDEGIHRSLCAAATCALLLTIRLHPHNPPVSPSTTV
jgi:hypothetical protein